MLSKIKKLLTGALLNHRKMDLVFEEVWNDHKSPKMNLGQLQSALNRQKSSIADLADVEFRVFSQFGDDGIIQYLIDNLPIQNKTFIEFGVENYREANTRFLLINNHWSGLVMDGSADHISHIRRQSVYSFYDLRATQAFITRENINDLLRRSGFNRHLGILSIDIDGNDYWVWEAIQDYEADIIICEYNALLGFEAQLTVPYRPDFVRGRSLPFSCYGISLAAAVELARQRGYFFIGCNSAGNNAYFIHAKHRAHSPLPETTAREGYRFSSFSESRDAAGAHNRGIDKVLALEGVELWDIQAGATCRFEANTVAQQLIRAGKINGVTA